MILYLLIGVLFQWLMHYATVKISSEYMFTHKERIALIFIWPIGDKYEGYWEEYERNG